MTNPTTAPVADNGVNVEALLAARAALTEAPEGARFKWRATSHWLGGTHSRATVDGFYGLGAEQRHHKAFEFDVDHPELFAATDHGATPARRRVGIDLVVDLDTVEAVAHVRVDAEHALQVHAAFERRAHRVQLDVAVLRHRGDARGQAAGEADEHVLDRRGAVVRRGEDLRVVRIEFEAAPMVLLAARVRNGFDGIKVHYEIDADATPEQIAALVAQSQKRSAVFDIIVNPTDVTVTSSKA